MTAAAVALLLPPARRGASKCIPNNPVERRIRELLRQQIMVEL